MDLLEVLKAELTQSLPGIRAQRRMAPKGRKFTKTPSIKKNAAVSLVIVDYPEIQNSEILLIKRPEYEGPHSGQVSFPGGKQEIEDGEPLVTAIRECEEETGVLLKTEFLAGQLTPLYIPVSKYMVYPFVFIYKSVPYFKIDKKEVRYIIEFPVSALLDKKLKQTTNLSIQGKSYSVPYYNIKNELVWGATAMIMSEFIEIISKIAIKNPGMLTPGFSK
jgi:8-oxo-dGTP pyrophosphatase MutT (NUDIX family)